MTSDHLDALVHQAQAADPQEAGGLLAGQGTTLTRLFPITNVATAPTTNFNLSPAELLRAFKQIEAMGLEVIGVYHSHPRTPPIPSPTDIWDASQHMPNVAHVIISLQGQGAAIKAWHIHSQQVAPITLIIGKRKQPADEPAALSPLQKAAIIASTIIALAALFIISFALLPPAPPLP